MIKFEENIFELGLVSSQYLIKIGETGHLMHLYYGEKIEGYSPEDMVLTYAFEQGRSTCYSNEHKPFNLNTALLEIATFGKGDYREPSLHIELENGARVTDFLYESHRIYKGKDKLEGLPSTYDCNETLEITLQDKINDIRVILSYSVFEKANAIARSLRIVNGDKQKIVLDRVMSMCVDFSRDDFELISLDGSWIKESHINTKPVVGINRIDSKKGVSSADHNPSFAIKRPSTTEESGEAYGFSLVYSSNFEAIIEANSHKLLRVMMGVNSFDFKWLLEKGDSFQAPEVIMTYSNQGLNGMSQGFHQVVKRHLVNGQWKNKERPILINNWEATYFDFTEHKLVNLAKKAKDLGIELFVLDDGWFSNRDDDTKGLGDYHPNKKKLAGGIPRIAKKINDVGLDFGIWIEPEMVNEDSELYRAHPEWAIKLPDREPSYGRNQLVLDLANEAVTDYIYKKLYQLFSSANISYCKWDMNRNFSDVYSNVLSKEEQYGYYHRYTLGLYKVLEKLKEDFPHILFEACCSGGSRFDMGILYYMPQVWTSDNTDGLCRQRIQYGTSLFYPPSVMGNHVSASPNHQTFRSTSIETRFNVAAFGLLGYELDLTKLTANERKAVKEQIVYYKTHRRLLQFGNFNRLISPFEGNICLWQVVDDEEAEVLVGYYQKETMPNPNNEKLVIPYVNRATTYALTNRDQLIDVRTFGNLINHELPVNLKVNGLIHNMVANNYEFHIEKEDKMVTGSMVATYGFRPKHQFLATGFNEDVRVMEDYGSRMYYLNRVND